MNKITNKAKKMKPYTMLIKQYCNRNESTCPKECFGLHCATNKLMCENKSPLPKEYFRTLLEGQSRIL